MLLTLQDKGLRITAWLGNMKPLLLEDLSLELAVSGKRPGEFLDPSHHQPSNQALTVHFQSAAAYRLSLFIIIITSLLLPFISGVSIIKAGELRPRLWLSLIPDFPPTTRSEGERNQRPKQTFARAVGGK